jgi:polyketide synthase PksJ
MENEKIVRSILEKIKRKEISEEIGRQLLQRITKKRKYEQEKNIERENSEMNIAIVGVSGQYPDAGNIDEFWDNLVHNVDSVKEVPKERWDLKDFFDNNPKVSNKCTCKKGGWLQNINSFDPSFFNISYREAEFMDPHQRLLLQESYKAFENAGYTMKKLNECRCGVFVGYEPGDYLTKLRDNGILPEAYTFTGTTPPVLSGRISYFLNLKGPSVTLNTGCSTSLVALSLACDSILSGNSEIALVGGISVALIPDFYILLSKLNMLSKDGVCRTFDKDADGFVPGEGVGAIVIKPLERALEDGDYIYGVIKGIRSNQDGKSNGITAPSVTAQAELEKDVYRSFNINPETISYIEGHGTGTELGDPIEIHALKDSFSEFTDKKQFCAIGSVKTNIGHTMIASGMASIIKVLLCMKHKMLVPSLHYNESNPHIDFEDSPFYVNTELKTWDTGELKGRRAAVSGFGIAGTNVHLVLEESRQKNEIPVEMKWYLIPVSAKNEKAYERKLRQILEWLDGEGSKENLGNIAYTLLVRRTHFSYRGAFITNNKEQLKQQLRQVLENVQGSTERINDLKKKNQYESLNIQFGEKLLLQANKEKGEKELLEDLIPYYLGGYELDWKVMYDKTNYTCIPMPTYPFDEKSFWPGEKTPSRKPICYDKKRGFCEIKSNDTFEENKVFYMPTWSEKSLNSNDLKLDKDEVVLVFDNSDEHFYDIVKSGNLISINSEQIYFIKEGKDFAKLGRQCFMVAPDNIKHYELMLSGIKEQGKRIAYIIQLWSKDCWCKNEAKTLVYKKLQKGIYSIFNLAKALTIQKQSGKVNFLYIYEGGKNSLYASIMGFFNTLHIEQNRYNFKAMAVDEINNIDTRLFWKEVLSCKQQHICYESNTRYEKGYTPYHVKLDENEQAMFRSKGVYFMTGGLGGIGFLIGSYLAKNYGATLILAGHSAMDEVKKQKIEELRRFGAEATYVNIDLTDEQGMKDVISDIIRKYGKLNGVFHCAGKTKDNIYLKKTIEEMNIVLSPKVFGTMYLDEATKNENLDFFLCFSSTTAVIGSLGLSDYAFSNGFMDEFCRLREEKVKIGERSGRSFSINWPLWKDGGMKIEEYAKQRIFKETGMTELETEDGIKLLEMVLKDRVNQVFVMSGDKEKIKKFFNEEENNDFKTEVEPIKSAASINNKKQIADKILTIISQETRIPFENLHENLTFEEIGIESILVQKINDRFEQEICNVPKTLFYECKDIHELIEYFIENHLDKLINNNDMIAVEKVFDEEKDEKEKIDYKNKNEQLIEVSVISMLSKETRIPKEMINSSTSFEELGIDSILIQKFNEELESFFGQISKTLFYEYQTVGELVKYILQNHELKVANHIYMEQENEKEIEMEETIPNESIAIIGISGQFSKAKNVDEYWTNLKEGKDCIQEVPKERWDWQKYYDEDKEKSLEGKSYCKWGGFIENVDKFDPLFFNISPKEAEVMDPQERFLVNNAWWALEDSGYTRENLHNEALRSNSNDVGVFVGVTSNTYALNGPEEWRKENYTFPESFPWSIANRISYLFNFNGPSLAIDTACSSSLYAVHLACESLRRKECKMAIAGGVNLYLHPSKYIKMCQIHMLSSKGKCFTFGSEADGFVPGEGVGTLILKPLNDAIRDKDNIYAVIKGSAINHDGKTNGYTVPNPNAQESLIKQALSMAKCDARSISYVEAHGTGTILGDPIEITGLTKAYKAYSDDRNYCAIGSVKSNIGHLEGAAGIAGLIKIILQMKHKKLVPSLNCSKLNKNIDFDNSPFFVQKVLQDWEKPTYYENGKLVMKPRRAGISAFGSGGANAHVIVEEYESEDQRQSSYEDKYIFILSAKNEERLREYTDIYEAFLRKKEHGGKSHFLKDMCYTLQNGREQLKERIAFVISNETELIQSLSKFNNSDIDYNHCFRGRISEKKQSGEVINNEAVIKLLEDAYENRNLYKIAELWVKGVEIQWERVYIRTDSRSISLPGYPFTKRTCWFKSSSEQTTANCKNIHPLIGENVSILNQTRFRTNITGEEFVLMNHVVGGKKMFPGAAYIEMALAGGRLVADKAVYQMKNVVFLEPFVVEDKERTIKLSYELRNGNMEYHISSEKESKGETVHSQGKILLETIDSNATSELLNVEQIKRRCSYSIDKTNCYETFKLLGLKYGEGFQVVEHLEFNENEVISELALQQEHAGDYSEYIMHPALLDGAFQTMLGLLDKEIKDTDVAYLPFSIDEIKVFTALQKKCFVYGVIREQSNGANGKVSKFDITITDSNGRVCVVLHNFAIRVLYTNKSSDKKNLYFKSEWKESNLDAYDSIPSLKRCLLMQMDDFIEGQTSKMLTAAVFDQRSFTYKSERMYEGISEKKYEINSEVYEDYENLFDEIIIKGDMPESIICVWNNKHEADRRKAIPLILLNLCKVLIRRKIIKEIQLIFVYPYDKKCNQAEFRGIASFMKSIKKESNKFKFKVIGLDEYSYGDFKKIINMEINDFTTSEIICYENMNRYEQVYEEVLLSRKNSKVIKEKGVYVLTGGLGGLGMIFASYLAKNYRASLLLIGKTPYADIDIKKLEQLEQYGADVQYVSADLGDFSQVKNALYKAKETFGTIDGIIHLAGLNKDEYGIYKTEEQVRSVIGPKVEGTVFLDLLTVEESLDFFVMFSSTSSVIGNLGQCDYAYANGYMDAFASWRSEQVHKGKRKGKTISINWPLWKNGGMKVDSETEKMFQQLFEMHTLKDLEGIEAFLNILDSPEGQYVVWTGKKDIIIQSKGQKRIEVSSSENAKLRNSCNKTKDELEEMLKGFISEILNVSTNEIDTEVDISEYGFDSISFTRLVGKINDNFNLEIVPTIFFEFATINELTQHILDNINSDQDTVVIKNINDLQGEDEIIHDVADNVSTASNCSDITAKLQQNISSIIIQILGIEEHDIDIDVDMSEYGFDSITFTRLVNKINDEYDLELNPTIFFEYPTIAGFVDFMAEVYGDKVTVHSLEKEASSDSTLKSIEYEVQSQEQTDIHDIEDVAVIGMSAKFPHSDSPEEFWRHLVNGDDLISKVPEERKEWQEFLKKCEMDGVEIVEWGGFIEDEDKFDALFFGISPREAELMDPQQRLFLEHTWKAIEHAGYKASELSGSNTGVFAGVAGIDYHDLLEQNNIPIDTHTITGMTHSILANRISYCFNFHGPSEAIDTACSSSLVAMHKAVRAINDGECTMAVAGGVSLMLSPKTTLSLSKAGMLSRDGHCKTFDENANGYVRGEGAGVIVLKSLKAAIKDGDYIYGVIRATSVNHGGRAKSLTAPNPNLQASLLLSAYQKAKVTPEQISYIEVHGTGTKLGDPIEINGLKNAFSSLYEKTQSEITKREYCGLGSVKTNIGHLEAGAGIAGVIKVLLALYHKTLPASLNIKNINRYIQLENSPFYVVTKTKKWEVLKDEQNNEIPRIAGVSSFGFGGTNAHIVLEEYKYNMKSANRSVYIFILSAKTKSQLIKYATNMIAFLKDKQQNGADLDLERISYTLQVGRTEMSERLAFTAVNMNECIYKLDAFVKGQSNESYLIGTIGGGKTFIDAATASTTLTEQVRKLAQSERWMEIVSLWCHGEIIDWKQLYEKKPLRIGLPTYPFEQTSYWIPGNPRIKNEKTLKILEKNWKSECKDVEKINFEDGTIIILSRENGDYPCSIATMLGDRFNVVVLIKGQKIIEKTKEGYDVLDWNDEGQRNKILLQYEDIIPQLIGIIDISDLNNELLNNEDIYGKLQLIQRLIDVSSNSIRFLLHITKGLLGFKTEESSLAGAEFATIVKTIAAEYQRIESKTIDIDNRSQLVKIIKDEMYMVDGQTELCYRDGVRYVSGYSVRNALTSKEEPLEYRDGVVVITGGTRGIGFEMAKHLADMGAKKMVLMGIQSLPPRIEWDTKSYNEWDARTLQKIKQIQQFEKKGVVIRIYTGPLTDKEALTSYFNQVRNDFGSILGVIHCAGISAPQICSFAHKTVSDFEKVLSPKVKGLQVLHEIFMKDELKFFIAFSSISAAIPALNVGISEYGCANGYMDYFVDYQRRRGFYYYKSINWGSFKDVGMGEVTSEKYKKMGFNSHSTQEGLKLFDEVMKWKDCSNIIACLSDSNVLQENLDGITKSNNKKKSTKKSIQFVEEKDNIINKLDGEYEVIEQHLKVLFSRELKIQKDQLKGDISFEEYGVDSILMAELIKSMEGWLNVSLDPSIILEYPTLTQLSEYIYKTFGFSENKTIKKGISISEERMVKIENETSSVSSGKIAVVGLACHFPKAENQTEFWDNLANGISSIVEVPTSRWDIDAYYSKDYENGKSISKWGGFIDDIEYFDAKYFQINEKAAPYIDPLMRQFLEVTAEAVADAGYEKKYLAKKKVGVFVGARVSNFSNKLNNVIKESVVGTGQNFIAANTSHFFDLRGPSMVIDTACSSSLASIHLACQSLMLNESSIAIAGGVDILLDEKIYTTLSEAKALSPDGMCHTFDEKANGFVPGEGCGVVILKKLEQAISDKDYIYAVIDGSAINNDGHTMGVTTPNKEAQKEVIEEALSKTVTQVQSISYIETHGTGTLIGDPIELRALTEVFQKHTDEKKYCAVGSVKTNIGHLLSAAGIASFIKVVLCLQHKKLVPSLNCETPNPRFAFNESPFYPITSLREWEVRNGVRKAGISGFGFGGTNVHIILSDIESSVPKEYRNKKRSLGGIKFHRKKYWAVYKAETVKSARNNAKKDLFVLSEEID